MAAPVGDKDGVGVPEGLMIDGLGDLVGEDVRVGDEEAPMEIGKAPGLEPTEDTEGDEPLVHTRLLICPMPAGRMLRYVTTASKM